MQTEFGRKLTIASRNKLWVIIKNKYFEYMFMESAPSLFERLGGKPVLLRLLHHFYADVRQHRLIGPVFEAQVENWPEHIEKIATFWSQVTGGPAVYDGGMPARHIPLGLKEEHFQAWLGLWEVNCLVWLDTESANELIVLAQQIGLRLRQFCGVSQPTNFDWMTVKFQSTPDR